MTLKIDMLGGNCPVQAKGMIDGKPFYFRARGQAWSIGIGGDVVGDPDWYMMQRWGDNEFAAGWMPEAEARKIIEKCAESYMRMRG